MCLAGGDAIAAQLTSNPSVSIFSPNHALRQRARVSRSRVAPKLKHAGAAGPTHRHLWKYDCIVPGAKTRTVAGLQLKRHSGKAHGGDRNLAATRNLPQPHRCRNPWRGPWLRHRIRTRRRRKRAPRGASAGWQPTSPLRHPLKLRAQRLQISSVSDAGSPQQPAPVAVPDSTSAAPTPPAAAADDLAPSARKIPKPQFGLRPIAADNVARRQPRDGCNEVQARRSRSLDSSHRSERVSDLDETSRRKMQ